MKRNLETIGLIVLLICLPLLAACGKPGTGIKGQAFLAECTGEQILTGCIDQQPYQATLVILDRDGNEVKRVQTEADGTFEILLDPGAYILHPLSTGPFPIAEDQIIILVEGEMEDVFVVYDSGIR